MQRTKLSAPLLETLRIDLLRLRSQPSVLPKSPLGRAIDYTLGLCPLAFTRPLSETETRILRKLLDTTMPDSLQPHLRNLLAAGTLGSFEQESIPVSEVWRALRQ